MALALGLPCASCGRCARPCSASAGLGLRGSSSVTRTQGAPGAPVLGARHPVSGTKVVGRTSRHAACARSILAPEPSSRAPRAPVRADVSVTGFPLASYRARHRKASLLQQTRFPRTRLSPEAVRQLRRTAAAAAAAAAAGGDGAGGGGEDAASSGEEASEHPLEGGPTNGAPHPQHSDTLKVPPHSQGSDTLEAGAEGGGGCSEDSCELPFFYEAGTAAPALPPTAEEERDQLQVPAGSLIAERDQLQVPAGSLIAAASGVGEGSSLDSSPGLSRGAGADDVAVSADLVKAESDFLLFTGYLAKYMIFMMTSGAALATFLELAGGGPHKEGLLWFCWTAGIVLGCMVGSRRILDGYARCGPRSVVVTGSTRGLGKALAREFLLSGDDVVITSRSEGAVLSAVRQLCADVEALGKCAPQAAVWLRQGQAGNPDPAPVNANPHSDSMAGRNRLVFSQGSPGQPCQRIVGVACDVQSPEDVAALAAIAKRELGVVDIWVNNAGTNTGAKPFMESSPEEVLQVVSTNLVGSMLCCQEAFRVLRSQPRGGHIFNMEGAGSEGGATPRYAVYGSTKSALRQFHATLLQECRGTGVGMHTASPGMVLTDLLLTGSTLQNKQAFNIVCEQPETVARALVPRMRAVRGTGKAVNYLTPPRIILAIISAWVRRGRWFDEEGRAVYAAEADRLRALAQGPKESPFLAALEALPSTAWLSLFTSSAIGVYLFVMSLGQSSGST